MIWLAVALSFLAGTVFGIVVASLAAAAAVDRRRREILSAIATDLDDEIRKGADDASN